MILQHEQIAALCYAERAMNDQAAFRVHAVSIYPSTFFETLSIPGGKLRRATAPRRFAEAEVSVATMTAALKPTTERETERARGWVIEALHAIDKLDPDLVACRTILNDIALAEVGATGLNLIERHQVTMALLATAPLSDETRQWMRDVAERAVEQIAAARQVARRLLDEAGEGSVDY